MQKLTQLPTPHTNWYLGVCDYPVYKMEIELDDSLTLDECNALHEMRRTNDSPPPEPMTKEQQGKARRDAQRWHNYTQGNAYVLYLQSRHMAHSFRAQAYGSTPLDAVKRWYRGLEGNDRHTRTCVRVVAVYTCVDPSSRAGDLLMGQAQPSYPY